MYACRYKVMYILSFTLYNIICMATQYVFNTSHIKCEIQVNISSCALIYASNYLNVILCD